MRAIVFPLAVFLGTLGFVTFCLYRAHSKELDEPEGWPLVRQLKSEDVVERRDAIVALARLGEDVEPAMPALIRALEEDPDIFVRRRAARALGNLGPKARPALGALNRAKLLHDQPLLRECISAVQKIEGRDRLLSLRKG